MLAVIMMVAVMVVGLAVRQSREVSSTPKPRPGQISSPGWRCARRMWRAACFWTFQRYVFPALSLLPFSFPTWLDFTVLQTRSLELLLTRFCDKIETVGRICKGAVERMGA
jgi:hypothetical protein